MKQKKVFLFILTAIVVVLALMPFTLSINDILTKLVERLEWYVWIQNKIVPIEIRMIGVVVKGLGIKFVAYEDGFTANGIPGRLIWNCLGWQSMILFFISLPFGFKGGKFTLLSKLVSFIIGFLGVFLLNILRVVFTIVLLVVSKPLYAIFFHNYLAALFTIAWLIFFWWFSYRYLLEEKET